MSKVVYMSDIHLRPSTPIYRKEGYVDQQFEKLQFMIDYANEIGAPIIVGGDLFDRACNHPTRFVNRVLEVMSGLEELWLLVPGNHDLFGHSLETPQENTLCTFSYWPGCRVAVEPCIYGHGSSNIYLTPFGTEPTVSKNPNLRSILVVHEPVFEDKVPFYMPEAYTQKTLKKKFPGYDMYLAGDIHIPLDKDDVHVTGSMMRMTTAQKGQHPRFLVIDTETLEVESVPFPIVEDVWKLQQDVENSTEFKAELGDLVDALQARGENITYEDACKQISGDLWASFSRLIEEYKSNKGE